MVNRDLHHTHHTTNISTMLQQHDNDIINAYLGGLTRAMLGSYSFVSGQVKGVLGLLTGKVLPHVRSCKKQPARQRHNSNAQYSLYMRIITAQMHTADSVGLYRQSAVEAKG
jgi:hypothetical protein